MQPLSYPSLQCVLQFMDPNLRVQVSLCCPSIRAADRSTPMKIDFLGLKEYDITINDIKYGVGIITKYNPGERVPGRTASFNDRGGETYDLDKFGLQVSSGETQPGDIVIDGNNLENEEERRQDDIRHWESLERRLKRRQESELARENFNVTRVMIASPFNFEPLPEMARPYRLKYSEEYKGAEITFKHYIQLSVYKRQGDDWNLRSKEIVEYNQKLSRAMKNLANRILQKSGLTTNTLKIHIYSNFKRYFRLPENCKITPKHLKIDDCRQAFLDAFRPVLNGTLKVFEELGKPRIRDYYDDPIVRTARKLIVFQSEGNFETRQITHRRVHSNLQPGSGAINMIESWIENGRDIGTHYSYEYSDKEIAMSAMEGIVFSEDSRIRNLERKGISYQCFVIPMNNNGLVVMFTQEVPGASKFILNFKVYPMGCSAISQFRSRVPV